MPNLQNINFKSKIKTRLTLENIKSGEKLVLDSNFEPVVDLKKHACIKIYSTKNEFQKHFFSKNVVFCFVLFC